MRRGRTKGEVPAVEETPPEEGEDVRKLRRRRPAPGEGVRRNARRNAEKVPMSTLIMMAESSADDSVFSPSPEVTGKGVRGRSTRGKKVTKTPSEDEKKEVEPKSEEDKEVVTDSASKMGQPVARSSKRLKSKTGEASSAATPRRSMRPHKMNTKYTDDDDQSASASPRNSPVKSVARKTPALEETEDAPPKKSARLRGKAEQNEVTTPKRDLSKVLEQASATSSLPETPRSSRRKKAITPAAETPIAASTPVPVAKKTPKKTPGRPATVKKELEGGGASGVGAGKQSEWKYTVYGIPKCPLPCREEQFEEIWKFLFENISEKNSGCMYVSGVPGTGKTVIVQAVVDTMKNVKEDDKKKEKKLHFKHLYINGLTLATPEKIWKRMFKALDLPSKSKGISSKEALRRLDSHFESFEKLPVVLVLDELDQILDKQQSVLYQLLEWSSHAKNMFSFIAIFNTINLPEKGLAMRNYSRMVGAILKAIGFKRAIFPPYSYDQLHTIVSAMLSTFKTERLNPDSISLLSRKVAGLSGDARRALEIARRTLEIAEAGSLSGIQAVSHAFKELFSSAKIETIKHTSLLEQLILKAICDEVRCSGADEVLTAKIYDSVVPQAAYEGMKWPKDEILKALMRLAVMRLLVVEDNYPSLHKRVLLKVPVEDVNFALGIQTGVDE